MTDFMNLRIQKGEETALIEFDNAGKSLSVYGVSVNNEFDVPRWDMTIMDNWELMMGRYKNPRSGSTTGMVSNNRVSI